VGELRYFMPEKNVTIVHGGPMLSNSAYPPKFRKALFSAVAKLGVQIVLGDKISPDVVPEDGFVTTEGGKRIQADMVVRPSSEPNPAAY
jgi:glycine/D-amino acid oxidase-like deaminating enzyme